MELKEYINIIKKRLLLIVVITLLSTFTAAVVSYFFIKPVYKADISVIIGKSNNQVQAQMNYNEILMYQKMVKTYGELAKTRTVAEDVVSKLQLNISPDTVRGMISVAPKGDTEFMTLTVTSRDAKEAMEIANQLAKSLKEISISVMKEDNVQIIDPAELPLSPDSPKPVLNMAIAFFMGIMLSVGIIFLLEYLDNTVKTQEDVEKLLGIPLIGIIPLIEESK
jgi:capsular polysaccharide biosynthesis protein